MLTRQDVEQLAREAINDAYPNQAHQMPSLVKSISDKFEEYVYDSTTTHEEAEESFDIAMSKIFNERRKKAKRYKLIRVEDEECKEDNS